MSNEQHSKRATEDLLDELHGLQAETMIDLLKRYRNGEIRDEDGNRLSPPPALLAQVTKFLKDNGIDRPRRPGNSTDRLADELADFEDSIDNVINFQR